MVDAVRLSAYQGNSYLLLFSDNLSSLLSAVHGRAATVCSPQNRLLQQLQQPYAGPVLWLSYKG